MRVSFNGDAHCSLRNPCGPALQARAFALVPVVFEIAIFTNIKLLQATSVETSVVFRTLVPLITSYADFAFMGRKLPSRQSAAGPAAAFNVPASTGPARAGWANYRHSLTIGRWLQMAQG